MIIEVNTMSSVGMANPNVQIVDIYDIFILEVCQSGVQLVSISKQYSNYLSYEFFGRKKSAPITLVKLTLDLIFPDGTFPNQILEEEKGP